MDSFQRTLAPGGPTVPLSRFAARGFFMLTREEGNGILPLPKKEVRLSLPKRIVSLRKRGKSYREISELAPASPVYVYRVLKDAGLVKARKRAKALSSRRRRKAG